MWEKGWRDPVWSQLDKHWDIIIIGGGITGAGILREAARAGYKVLLLEANDFSSGTSSRSSKLVHGGFRYLQNAKIKLTYESVRERERLLKEGRGLITPLGCLLANYRQDAIPSWVFGAGLIIYDLLALKWGHRRYDSYDIHDLCPSLCEDNLIGGYRFFDAQTDDARLVLRIIFEAVQDGGVALNYTRVIRLLRQASGRVCGVALKDESPESGERTKEILGSVVINATGIWADEIRQYVGGVTRLRKLRGSHLIFPADKFPLKRAINCLHPWDNRPVFAIPWEGVTLVGTTDIDHDESLYKEPRISSQEIEYLMAFVKRYFPSLSLTAHDIQATYSGIRPVVNTGKANPSKESREHILWDENGLLTVAGGKLTTFRVMAHDVLRRASRMLPQRARFDFNHEILSMPPAISLQDLEIPMPLRLRLMGRYGEQISSLINQMRTEELATIDKTPILWAELRWVASSEGVCHLDDLLLRRVRLGLLAPQGGMPLLNRIRQIVQPELGWDDERWSQEVNNYMGLWKSVYAPNQ